MVSNFRVATNLLLQRSVRLPFERVPMHSAAVGALTAMTLSIGYLVAAAGPFLLGVVHDAAGGWGVPLVLLAAIVAAELPAGLAATRDWTV